MNAVIQKIIDANAPMQLNPPATAEAIERFEMQQDIEFPAYYREFLLYANGGHLFAPAGPDFYGVDLNNEQYSLVKANSYKARAAGKIPASLYIVGDDGNGDKFCIDFETKKFIQWNREKQKESRSWVNVFKCIAYEFKMYEEAKEMGMNEDADPNDTVSVITNLVHHKGRLYVTLEKGIFAGQMIRMLCSLRENGALWPMLSPAKQISPVPLDAIPTDEELQFIRTVPLYDLLILRHALQVYCDANQIKIDLPY